jgi:hypothetical protein
MRQLTAREIRPAAARAAFAAAASSFASAPLKLSLCSFGRHSARKAYVSIRQHTSAYVSIRQHTSRMQVSSARRPSYVSIRQHTSAYVHACRCPLQGVPLTSAYVSMRACMQADTCEEGIHLIILVDIGPDQLLRSLERRKDAKRPERLLPCIRQHTSAYVSIRQHTSAYVGIHQHKRPERLRPCRAAPQVSVDL